MRRRSSLVPWIVLTLSTGCALVGQKKARAPHPPGRWALALHGGAGVERTTPPAELQAALAGLTAALGEGRRRLAAGQPALDTCEAVVRMLEDDPHFNAGRGAAFNARAEHELDASIMDGRTLGCGGVAGVRTVKNPIALARLVMERTPHVLLIGDGAEEFAAAVGVERVPNSYFDTPRRRELLDEVLNKRRQHEPPPPGPATRGTVGCTALDRAGNLAAATSTGGLTGKQYGRVGDSPLIGAGTYASNTSCAVSCTGTGEEFIRHGVARSVAALVEYKGLSLGAAAEQLVHRTLKRGDGGLIAVAPSGDIAMVYSSDGMYRAAADSAGRFEVKVWD
ncbi:MAG: isoaspartyl peptidase/L-asparaginase [Polyangia bacterium]